MPFKETLGTSGHLSVLGMNRCSQRIYDKVDTCLVAVGCSEKRRKDGVELEGLPHLKEAAEIDGDAGSRASNLVAQM